MNKAVSNTVTISIATLLVLGLSSCTTDHTNHNQNPTPSASETSASIPRQASGYIATYPEIMELKDAANFEENNFLAVSTTRQLTINSYGTVEKSPGDFAPAENEVFHAVHYSYIPPKSGDERAALTISINGETKPLGVDLLDKGTLLISAPQDAEILLGWELEDVKQEISIKDAKRATPGVADGFYGNPVGKVDNGTVSKVVPVGDISPTLKYSVLEAVRTPYIKEESIGWAEGGKNTWVVLNMSPVEWELQGFDPLQSPNEALLVDDDGKTYTPKLITDGVTTDNNKLAFSVPADKTTFTLQTNIEAEFTSWGKKAGSTGTIENNDTKITFEAVNK